MRVLQVIPSVSSVHGGPSRALALMEQGLSARGIEVTTVATDDDGPKRRLGPDAPPNINGVRRIYFRKWLDTYKVAPGMVPWLWSNVAAYDVVHIHALFSFASVAAAQIALARNCPYVIRPLGTLNRYGLTQRRPWLKRASSLILENRILTGAAAVHFTSDLELQDAKRLDLPLRPVVIPLAAVPEKRGHEETKIGEHPAAGAGQSILFVSRLHPIKNVESLLRAFALIAPKHADATLAIAGDGQPDYCQSLKQLARSLGVERRVVWLGYVEAARKAAVFAAARIFVLPSFSENFGIAAAEAMMAGVPCILGEGVGIATDAARAGACLSVTPDAPSIANALDSLLSDPAKCQAMGRTARAFAEREYSVETMTSRLVALYRDAAGGRGRTPL